MSIIQVQKDAAGKFKSANSIEEFYLTPDKTGKMPAGVELSPYNPSDEVKRMRQQIIRHFTLGYVTMYTPRVEFNDVCVLDRMQIDQMSWNTYQPNNGGPLEGDGTNAWKSRAVKPIVRNKCISIAAHATARLIYPKIFAYDELSNTQEDAAQVMRDLMEWACDQSNYENTSLRAVITALTDPVALVYSEYGEVYRQVKREKKKGGGYVMETILDDRFSGFKDELVPCDEVFIENFYQSDWQKQEWLIRRRVYGYGLAKGKYGHLDNFKYVKPGVQLLYNDANQSFYQVYDTNMRQYDIEEVVYWNKGQDVKITLVNGVMLSDPDEANPRNDKLYPFSPFGYELINNRCAYFKSLAFKTQQDANIVNTLYPMIIDGTYLNVFPAMVNMGGEQISSDVIVPGAVTTFTDPNAKLMAIQSSTPQGLLAGMQTLQKVEESLGQSAETPVSQDSQPGDSTAYEISRIEQNAATVLGLFIKMISQYVKAYGTLKQGDIIQYLTIIDADKITDKPELVYKSFLLNERSAGGKIKSRKIQFTGDLPEEPITEQDHMKLSYQALHEQGGQDSNMELFKVNPEKFRDLKYIQTVDADVMNPRSEELERAFDLETYDRLVLNPASDQEETLRLLLSTDPKTKKDPDKFVGQQNPADPLAMVTAKAQGMNPQGQGTPQGQGGPAMPNSGNGPLATANKGLPQTMPVGAQR